MLILGGGTLYIQSNNPERFKVNLGPQCWLEVENWGINILEVSPEDTNFVPGSPKPLFLFYITLVLLSDTGDFKVPSCRRSPEVTGIPAPHTVEYIKDWGVSVAKMKNIIHFNPITIFDIHVRHAGHTPYMVDASCYAAGTCLQWQIMGGN